MLAITRLAWADSRCMVLSILLSISTAAAFPICPPGATPLPAWAPFWREEICKISSLPRPLDRLEPRNGTPADDSSSVSWGPWKSSTFSGNEICQPPMADGWPVTSSDPFFAPTGGHGRTVYGYWVLCFSVGLQSRHPLVKAMENHCFHRPINYKWATFYGYVGLPEGNWSHHGNNPWDSEFSADRLGMVEPPFGHMCQCRTPSLAKQHVTISQHEGLNNIIKLWCTNLLCENHWKPIFIGFLQF